MGEFDVVPGVNATSGNLPRPGGFAKKRKTPLPTGGLPSDGTEIDGDESAPTGTAEDPTISLVEALDRLRVISTPPAAESETARTLRGKRCYQDQRTSADPGPPSDEPSAPVPPPKSEDEADPKP
jgi:hypothetical protein